MFLYFTKIQKFWNR